MEKRNRIAFVYLIIGAVFLFGWGFVRRRDLATTADKAKPEELFALVGGTPIQAALDVEAPELAAEERKTQFPDTVGIFGGSAVTAAIKVDAPALAAAERRAQAVKKAAPSELLAMGKGEKPFHLQAPFEHARRVRFSRSSLSYFQQADREGLPVVNPDGTPKLLHLLPGRPLRAHLQDRRPEDDSQSRSCTPAR